MHDLDYLRLLEAAVEHSFDSVVITTAGLEPPGPEIIYANPAFQSMSGYTLDELRGQNPRILQGPRTSRATLDRLKAALHAGQAFSARTVNYRKDGSAYDVEWSISPVRGTGGEVTHFVSVQRDITAETRERRRREMLVNALDETSDQVVITDQDVRILDVNKSFERHTGFTREEVRGKNPRILQSGMHDRAFYQRMWNTLKEGEIFRATFIDRRKDGRLVHLEETITPVRDENGDISGYVSIGKDVSARVETEKELMRLATTDMLTGLTNRMHFEKLFLEELERSRRYEHPLSLIMIDIDNFKSINDRYGHAVGDEVLTRFAQRLSGNLRAVDILARVDKDHSSSVSGGFTVTRKPETVSATSSRMEMELITLKASSLFGLAYATEEILTDSPMSFAALIDSGFRDQFPAHILDEKIRGNGGAEFLGVLESDAEVVVAKETGQDADTIVADNVIKMAERSWGFGSAIWLANHDTRHQLSTLTIATGTGGVLIYQPSDREGFPDMLLGRPVFYTEYASTLGDAGDIMLVNWSQYLEGLYQPLESAESVHVRFVNHERAFKFWLRNAGAPWWRSALTPAQSSDTLSPIVTLAARA